MSLVDASTGGVKSGWMCPGGGSTPACSALATCPRVNGVGASCQDSPEVELPWAGSHGACSGVLATCSPSPAGRHDPLACPERACSGSPVRASRSACHGALDPFLACSPCAAGCQGWLPALEPSAGCQAPTGTGVCSACHGSLAGACSTLAAPTCSGVDCRGSSAGICLASADSSARRVPPVCSACHGSLAEAGCQVAAGACSAFVGCSLAGSACHVAPACSGVRSACHGSLAVAGCQVPVGACSVFVVCSPADSACHGAPAGLCSEGCQVPTGACSAFGGSRPFSACQG